MSVRLSRPVTYTSPAAVTITSRPPQSVLSPSAAVRRLTQSRLPPLDQATVITSQPPLASRARPVTTTIPALLVAMARPCSSRCAPEAYAFTQARAPSARCFMTTTS